MSETLNSSDKKFNRPIEVYVFLLLNNKRNGLEFSSACTGLETLTTASTIF